MRRIVQRWRRAGERIAFVPTMGALHEGHLRLVREARKHADRVVVSIYVNPTQFGPKEDLRRYPRPIASDRRQCRHAGVDVVFAPFTLYVPDHSTWVQEEFVSQGRCGASRPGHFRGVATVVLKLFHIVQPDIAVFGWKDAQQVEVIQRLVRDLDLDVQILAVETVRDRDGLALSSRNVYLSPEERNRALALPLLLRVASERKEAVVWLRRALSRMPGMRLDYVEESQGRLCAALWVGKTHLIDNVPMRRT